MPATPPWLIDKIRAHYSGLTDVSYLDWGGETLGFHFGLANADTATREDSLVNSTRFLAERARVDATTTVLDAGCGVGGSSIWLARERGATVVGITLSPRQVELAQEFARERGVADRTSFHAMDFAATTFAAASFDVVWNLESMCHTSDLGAYLQHVLYLLRDGGRFVCMDMFLGTGGDPAHARAMCEGWVLPNLRTHEEVAAEVRRAGFLHPSSVDLTPEVLRPAAAMRAVASAKKLQIRLGQAFGASPEDALHLAHLDAALGAADGMVSGSVTYGFVGGTRPPR
jgi:tocopherol O-methyltransferase